MKVRIALARTVAILFNAFGGGVVGAMLGFVGTYLFATNFDPENSGAYWVIAMLVSVPCALLGAIFGGIGMARITAARVDEDGLVESLEDQRFGQQVAGSLAVLAFVFCFPLYALLEFFDAPEIWTWIPWMLILPMAAYSWAIRAVKRDPSSFDALRRPIDLPKRAGGTEAPPAEEEPEAPAAPEEPPEPPEPEEPPVPVRAGRAAWLGFIAGLVAFALTWGVEPRITLLVGTDTVIQRGLPALIMALAVGIPVATLLKSNPALLNRLDS